MQEYRVQFDVFEGPLDLLLHLVKKQEVDIYQINLAKVASEFVDYLNQMRALDLEVAGEFLVMAATLIFIKSRELLPKDQRAVVAENEEEEDDPRFELIRRLVEYKKFKDAAAQLQEREAQMDGTYQRRPAPVEFLRMDDTPPGSATVWDLVKIVNQLLKRLNTRDDIREIQADPYTVSEKMESLRLMIQTRPRFRVSELFADATNKVEIVVTFLAILELTRLKLLVLHQSEDFGEIDVELAPPGASNVGAAEALATAVVEPVQRLEYSAEVAPNSFPEDLPGFELPPPEPERTVEQVFDQEPPATLPLAEPDASSQVA